MPEIDDTLLRFAFLAVLAIVAMDMALKAYG